MTVSLRPLSEAFAFDVQWVDLFHAKRCNWVDFDFIRLRCEYDKIGAQFEIEAALIGFYVRICIPLADTKQSLLLKSRIAEVEADHSQLVPLAEFEARLKAQLGVKEILVHERRIRKGEGEKNENQ